MERYWCPFFLYQCRTDFFPVRYNLVRFTPLATRLITILFLAILLEASSEIINGPSLITEQEAGCKMSVLSTEKLSIFYWIVLALSAWNLFLGYTVQGSLYLDSFNFLVKRYFLQI